MRVRLIVKGIDKVIEYDNVTEVHYGFRNGALHGHTKVELSFGDAVAFEGEDTGCNWNLCDVVEFEVINE